MQEKAAKRRLQHAADMRMRRRLQTPEKTAERRDRDAANKRTQRLTQEPEKAAKIRLQHAAEMRMRRRLQTPEKTAERRDRDAANKRTQRLTQEPEKAAKTCPQQAADKRRRLQTPEEAPDICERDAANKRKRRRLQTPEEASGRRERDAANKRTQKLTQEPDKEARRCRENAASMRKCSQLQSAQEDTDIHIQEIATDILQRRDIDEETLQFISSHQNFTKHPHLALAYFHCCGNHPDAFVFNDETLQGDEGATVRARLTHALDSPPGVEEATRCQTSVREHDSTSAHIWFCASCNRKIEQNERNMNELALHNLPPTFLVTPDERLRFANIPIDIVLSHLQVVISGCNMYHLNPDLVPDYAHIRVCDFCMPDPRRNTFSIASGHDYGRRGDLPDLSDVAKTCISAVRRFGLELSLSGQHSSGHAIHFQSDGPTVCATSLPRVGEECVPRVTFVGPADHWRVKKKQFRKLYAIPADDVYAWLRVLSAVNNIFRRNNIVVDTSRARRHALEKLQQSIEKNVQCTTAAYVNIIDAETSGERYGEDLMPSRSEPLTGDTTQAAGTSDGEHIPLMHSAVLKNPLVATPHTSSAAVEAMLGMLPTCDGDGDGEVDPPKHSDDGVLTIQREGIPLCEWNEMGELLAGSLVTCFITGDAALKAGPFSSRFIDHLLHYYDGRFEQDTMLISVLFNQLQRHAAVRKAALVATTHAATLTKLGKLANEAAFRTQLQWARDNPGTVKAKRLNAHLLRLLSLVGGTVPFSPFERASARPKLRAMRYRYDIAQHFITVAPPEHDDLSLLRVSQIRKTKCWNDCSSVYSSDAFTREDLPPQLLRDARQRISIVNRYPVQAAMVFKRKKDLLLNDIIRCPSSRSTRLSRDYTQRESGAYTRVAAFNLVVEPQMDGHLHLHMTVYGSAYTPGLLTRIAGCAELQQTAAAWLDGVTCTRISDANHDWMLQLRESEQAHPRSCEVVLPDAATDYGGFVSASEQKCLSTNMHTHSSTCRKGKRGKFMCRLSMSRGVHDFPTCPLMLLLRHRGDMEKGVRALVEGRPLNTDTVTFLDGGYDLEAGEFLPRHPPLPIVWEQQRPKRDAKFVECNLTMAALLDSHSNSSTITSTYAGEVADEYEANYMTKEGAGLKYAASMMLTAIDHIARYPSVAPDAGSLQRTGMHLATRTVNAFVGGHEWSLRLMAYALMGFVSFESSDSHWYIYPHDLVTFVAQERCMTTNAAHLDNLSDISDIDFERALGDMIAEMDKDDDSGDAQGKRKGTRTYKCDGQLVFVTQAESFKHRGPHFIDYSPLEFVAIIDILLPKKPAAPSPTGAGRPRRCGFPLAPTHPLSPYGFLAYIRVKFLTPMFGGAPPPTFPSTVTPTAPRKHHRDDDDDDDDDDGDERGVHVNDHQGTSPGECKVDALAKYLLCTFAPWQSTPLGPVFEFNATGLAELCRQWDRHNASLVNRQRYRYLRNVMLRGHRNSRNEETTTLWRSRNADWWKDLPGKGEPCEAPSGKQATSEDNEAHGRLPSNSDVYLLTNAAALGNPVSKAYIDVLQTQFANLFSVDDGATTSVESCAKVSAVVYAGTHNHSEHDCHSPVVPSLRQLATNLQKMTLQQRDDEEDTPDRPDRSCVTGVHDPLAGPRHCHTALVAPCFLSQNSTRSSITSCLRSPSHSRRLLWSTPLEDVASRMLW